MSERKKKKNIAVIECVLVVSTHHELVHHKKLWVMQDGDIIIKRI